MTFRNWGGQTSLMQTGSTPRARRNRALISALRRAHSELQLQGIDLTSQRCRFMDAKDVDDPYLRKLTGLAFLAPDIQNAILEGRQPTGLTLSAILSTALPLDWHGQRMALGLSTN